MQPRLTSLRATLVALAFLLTGLAPAAAAQDADATRPNVLWIYVEDMEDWLGCYGETRIATPHVDGLATRGARFTRAYVPAPVCSATRSALITGAMQTTLGLHNHRSARGTRGQPPGDAITLPEGVRTVPELLRAAGYHTFNQGKLDYNFLHEPRELYDRHQGSMNFERFDLRALWRPAVAAGKPFFGQIQLRGGKNSGEPQVADRTAVEVPPYYPDIDLVREEYAHHLDCVAQTDRETGEILAALAADGLLESTVVFFFSDHGFRMHRHKQFCYEGGIRVPCVVAGPGVPQGVVRDDLVSALDIPASTLALAGVARPAWSEGRDLFAADHEPRTHVISARDRLDYTIDRIRAVVTQRYKYLRNGLPDRPYMQPQYRDPWEVTKRLRAMAAAGELDATQMAFYGEARPVEELYDLVNDPHETVNLAHHPAHLAELARHRALLDAWIETTGDKGQQPESMAGLREVLARWGDRCVNPEYDAVRAAIAAEEAGRPRVLILGDSISMGYTPVLERLLRGEAVVRRPDGNCEGTTKGVQKVAEWLAFDGGRWDVVHANFGLHDLKRVQPGTMRNSNDPSHPRQAEPEVYEQQLERIVEALAATGARIVLATTTPVPEGGVRPHRDPADVDRYNEIMRRVAARHGATVHELGAAITPHLAEMQQPVNVHFTPAGSRFLAERVAGAVRAAIAARGRR